MLQELFEAISAQAVKANSVQEIHAACEPNHRYALISPSGEIHWQEAEPKPRQHYAGDLSAIALFAAKSGDKAAVWFSRAGVVCFTDDATRRDYIQLPLDLSPQLKAVMELERTRKPWKQRDLILFLRTTLRACLAPSGNIIAILRRVKFTVNSGAQSAIEHGKKSVGRQLDAEVTGTDVLPEYIGLDVPIFASGFPGITGRIELALEPDPETETFALIPIPGEVERLILSGEMAIGIKVAEALAEMSAEDVPVYFGKP